MKIILLFGMLLSVSIMSSMCCYENSRVDVHGRSVDEISGKPKRARVSFLNTTFSDEAH